MNRARPVIAIDGPVSAGKSTAARALARALHFTYLNTGAMYRAVAIAAREAGVKADDPALERKLGPILAAIRIRLAGERVILNGRDVTALAREQEIGDLASRLSTLAPVRARMRELQRAQGERGGVVMEGRDIGTAVFPDAEFKFYLDADPAVRAERRYRELVHKGGSPDREEILREVIERDRRDRARKLAPLRRARDAVVVDATNLSVAEVVALLKSRVRESIKKLHATGGA